MHQTIPRPRLPGHGDRQGQCLRTWSGRDRSGPRTPRNRTICRRLTRRRHRAPPSRSLHLYRCSRSPLRRTDIRPGCTPTHACGQRCTHPSPIDQGHSITSSPLSDSSEGRNRDGTPGVFPAVLNQIRQRGITLPCVHTANSAAIVRFPTAHFSLVRPGIMLYGYHTLPDTVPAPDLKPVLSLRTTVVQRRTIPQGGTVSYNGTFVATRPTRIAVLPIGYADGYSRRLSHRGLVLIQGRRVPIVGLVCMDMIMVDVTDLAPVRIGEPVTLIGQQGEESIWADEVAGWIDTIPYEILCGIGSRVPRIYESA
ncbi:MAG: alanine racemase [Nitrospira sp.]|nr:MAG: alanine racemase [Nitrospira sp.]